MDTPIDFEAVLAEERQLGGMPATGKALALALSGGGIRSTIFNLGVIQALAELKLLRRFDYLSTISGGGHIGAWLSLFIKRYADGRVEDAENLLVGRDARGLEHPAIRFLRAFSAQHNRYTAVSIATYLSNLLLNLTILVTLLGALLLVPRIAALGAEHLQFWQRFDKWFDALLIALLLAPTFTVALNLLSFPASRGVHRPWFMRSRMLRLTFDIPVLAAAFFAAAYYVQLARAPTIVGSWFNTVTGGYFLLWLLGMMLAVMFLPEAKNRIQQLVSPDRIKWNVTFVSFAVLAGTVGAVLLLIIAKAIGTVPEAHRLWVGVALGPPSVIVAFIVMVVVHLGFMVTKFSERDRDIWYVFVARLSTLALAWTGTFCIAFYGPALLGFLGGSILVVVAIVWIGVPLIAVLASIGKLSAEYLEALTAATQKSFGRAASLVVISPWQLMRIFSSVAPYVFLLGLLIVLSWGVHHVLQAAPGALRASAAPLLAADHAGTGIHLHARPAPGSPVLVVGSGEALGLWQQFTTVAADDTESIRRWFEPSWALPAMALAALLTALLISWRVNINVISQHNFYRGRLTRLFLGATNVKRSPHALTGLDPGDDVALTELRGQKPMQIVGTAISLNRGRQLALRSRQTASFAFTPLRAGYEPASAQVTGCFRPVNEYGMDSDGRPITLGTVIAISGATTNPLKSYYTSRAVAFLTAIFNVRPGLRCGDTRHESAWRFRDPQLGLRYWLADLSDDTDQDYPFVSLSDGRHFEALGVYELVRRRCALVLVSDAGDDPQYAFEDLALAMNRCSSDFGVDFRFRSKLDAIVPMGDIPSRQNYAIADIVYPDGLPPGVLVYLKSSLSADMAPNIMHRQRMAKNFPHDSAADSQFDESQFECYRQLGYEVAMRSLHDMRAKGELPIALT